MGLFKSKSDSCPDLSLPEEDYDYLEKTFGKQAADETKKDVEDGKISVETLEKYLYYKE